MKCGSLLRRAALRALLPLPARLRFGRSRRLRLAVRLPVAGLPVSPTSSIGQARLHRLRRVLQDVVACGRAASSSDLISSQLSRFSPARGFSRTRCQAPLQLVALQLEVDMALLHRLGGIAFGRPVALVPDDHRAAAIFALRGSCLRRRHSRADDPRHGRRAAFRAGRGSGRASPPSSTARRHARAGDRSAAASHHASG